MTISFSGTSGLTFPDNSTQATAATGFGFKNRIINGAMMIDQRNGGAALNMTASNQYSVDRWSAACGTTPTGTLTAQRVGGDATSQNAIRISKTTGTYLGGLNIYQVIESANCYPLAGKTVVLSFRARVGSTFTGNMTPTRFIYTGTGVDQGINGGTGGTWTGWASVSITNIVNPTLTTTFQTYQFIGTIGASVTEILVGTGRYTDGSSGSANDYIEITDVQLEAGSTATSFDYRPYGTELALCQRYLPGYIYSSSSGSEMISWARGGSSANLATAQIVFPVTARVPPTGVSVTGSSWAVSGTAFTTVGFSTSSTSVGHLDLSGGSGMTAFAMYTFTSSGVGSKILFTGCEL